MNIYLYNDKDTPVHRLDPRTKLLLLAATFILSVLHAHPVYILTILVLVLIHAGIARCFNNINRIRYLLIVIFFFSIMLWAVFAKGTTGIFWRVSYESLLYGTGVGLKLDTMLISGVIFLSTTRNEDLTQGLIKLKLPYSFSFAFSTALRLLPMLMGTAESIIQAQKSRGLDLESGNIIARTKKHIPLLVPIFLTSIRSTDQFAMALDSKGFKCKKTRTFYNVIRFNSRDWVISGVTMLVLALWIWLKFAGYGQIHGLSI